MKDYYSLLNVKPNASPAQIDAAYRRLMTRHHPNARSSPQMLDRLRDLNEAWRVLSDPAQRAAYDSARTQGGAYQPQSAPATMRVVPQSAVGEFGAQRRSGGSCLVRSSVVLVLVFAVAVLLWGLNQQVNFSTWWEQTQTEINTYIPLGLGKGTAVAQADVSPTPDPRCRNGCETPPAGCVVKGDIQANGVRYFYLPNDEGYGDVQVNIAKGDRWFCALNDAQSAGWTRKAPTETPPPTLPPEAFTTNVARRNLIVCADNVALHQGPGKEFPTVQPLENGARVAVTGVNGDWFVVNTDGGEAYAIVSVLCTPTRAAAAPITADAGNATPFAQATASPVANPAATTFKYSAPGLIEPTNGARYWCSRDLILTWAINGGALAADEYFLVESKPHERERWTALADWTKDTRVMLHPSKGGGTCDTVWWANTGAYQWRVSVVRGNKDKPEYLSPFSAVNDIIYAQ